jgi:hypothetical protein
MLSAISLALTLFLTRPPDSTIVLATMPVELGESPHDTRYFFGPSGYNLRSGAGYYQNTWVLVNQVSYGVSDNFSIGVGVVPIFLLGGETPLWITPKLNLPIREEKVALGLGALAGTIVGENTRFGIAYGVGTFGSRETNLTVGLGYGYADGSWTDWPIVTVSGIYTLNDRFSLMTENYYLEADGYVTLFMAAGVRWKLGQAAIDFGLVTPRFSGDGIAFFALPWLSLTVPFGRGKLY